MVTPAGLEPATPCLEGRCSIQLSFRLGSKDQTLTSIPACKLTRLGLPVNTRPIP